MSRKTKNIDKTLVPLRVDPAPLTTYLDPSVDFDNYKDIKSIMENLLRVPTVVEGTIMPDGCRAGTDWEPPVGSVITTENTIFPRFHSADLCCSMFLTRISKSSISIEKLWESAVRAAKFGHREGNHTAPDALREEFKNNSFLSNQKIQHLMNVQLGTSGDGNHFIFIGYDDVDYYIISHFGSRGVGANLYKLGKQASTHGGDNYEYMYADSDIGQEYWEALQLVRKWTKLSHQLLHDSIMGQRIVPVTQIFNEHNFVFSDGNLYHHAKGSTPMHNFDNKNYNYKIIPLNMASPILIVAPYESKFAPHGAGRMMSRRKFLDMYGDDREKLIESVSHIKIESKEGETDITEFPQAYKNAGMIKREIQKYKLARIVGEVKPYGTIMAGNIPRGKRR